MEEININLKKQLTFKDILKEANIDYDNVEQDLIELANSSETEDEFFQKFDTYFSEHGLGGDDCHDDAVRLLQLFIERSKYKINDYVKVKGNSGFIYSGKILEVLADDLLKIRFRVTEGYKELVIETNRIV